MECKINICLLFTTSGIAESDHKSYAEMQQARILRIQRHHWTCPSSTTTDLILAPGVLVPFLSML